MTVCSLVAGLRWAGFPSWWPSHADIAGQAAGMARDVGELHRVSITPIQPGTGIPGYPDL